MGAPTIPAGPPTTTTAPLLVNDYAEIVRLALAEDIGSGDVTTTLTVPPAGFGQAAIRQKQPGCIYGHEVAAHVFRQVDAAIDYEPSCAEGELRDHGEVARVTGPLAGLITAERTALNFLMHLSGVATAAARATTAVAGTGAQILDTRKTGPGIRVLEKAAALAGGATNHRRGLYDAVLIKENHIAAAGGIARAVGLTLAGTDLPVEVECQSLAEIDQALAAGATHLLLDNMSNALLRQAVDLVAGRARLEASGGYTLDNVAAAAETGVNFISMGSITHSAPALDLSLVIERSQST